MGIRCWFSQCNWVHIVGGLYQCSKCKTVSVGAYRQGSSLTKKCDDGKEVAP